jgi:hypothetical protein
MYKTLCALTIVPLQPKSKANMKEAKINSFQQQTAAPMTQLPDKLLFGQQCWQPMRHQLIYKSTLMIGSRQPTAR